VRSTKNAILWALLAMLIFASNTVSCFAAPIIMGETPEGRVWKVTWSVYDEFAVDNPLPSNGEFTYVYNIEGPPFSLLGALAGFGLLVDSSDLSSTEISGDGVPFIVISPGRWSIASSSERNPSALSQQTVDLIVTSGLAPGPITAQVHSCRPVACFRESSEVIGPAVPEPATWLLSACLISIVAFLRCRAHIQ